MTKVITSTKIDINEPNNFMPFNLADRITIVLNSKQSAEEMFEELGYTREYTENEYSISIVYKEYIEDRKIINYIDFKYRKSIDDLSIVPYQTPINLNEYEIPYEFNIYELMAIIKQIQELEENKNG